MASGFTMDRRCSYSIDCIIFSLSKKNVFKNIEGMKLTRHFTVIFLSAFIVLKLNAQLDITASKALIQRIIPNHASQFIIESLDASAGKDVFEIESRSNKIVLKGNNGVALASRSEE